MSTFDDMVAFVVSAYQARSFIVPCLQGPPGIGKTAAVEEAAHQVGAGKVVTIIASQILPNEVTGITMPVAETKAMEIFDHYRLASLEDGDILFFDELLEADQLVLSACLTLIESRRLMSGRELPDVMVVAATNPTILPTMLKENIRQRFVWRKFDVDREGTRQYIKDTCGFDVGLGVVRMLTCEGNEYNILTPRSLTKMAKWISMSTSKEKAREIGKMIDTIWSSSLGTSLAQAYSKKFDDPDVKIRMAISHALDAADVKEKPDFDDASLAEIMETLQNLPEWEKIHDVLVTIEVDEEDEIEIEF